MERIILDELNWDLYATTPIDFIYMFHALLISGHPPPSLHGLHTGLDHHYLGVGEIHPRLVLSLYRSAEENTSQSTEFIHCKEMVDEYLTSLEFSLPANAVYIFNMTKQHQDDEGACRQTGTQTDQEWKGESGAGGRGQGGRQGSGG
ncbi:hypothetical protein J4Q44_G00128520 [Coregonus suidteri]|uniref:Uncharacterized protein n=1 Tax=Coregonus suidteri TaxID=861788 RepID=A0AAN8R8E6_9TELE